MNPREGSRLSELPSNGRSAAAAAISATGDRTALSRRSRPGKAARRWPEAPGSAQPTPPPPARRRAAASIRQDPPPSPLLG